MHEKQQRDGRTVYVPKPGTHLRREIAAGSGIVGTAVPPDGIWLVDRVLIDYEGGIYGQSGMESYEFRVYHAYDRHTWKGNGYPTVARALVNAADLIAVGTFDPETRTIDVRDQEVVDEWVAGWKPRSTAIDPARAEPW